jgi:hypothetical protein
VERRVVAVLTSTGVTITTITIYNQHNNIQINTLAIRKYECMMHVCMNDLINTSLIVFNFIINI